MKKFRGAIPFLKFVENHRKLGKMWKEICKKMHTIDQNLRKNIEKYVKIGLNKEKYRKKPWKMR